MKSTSDADKVSDPTMAALVPRRSTWRNLILFLVAAVALVAVGSYAAFV